jgi:hypothetical protein
VNRWVGYGIGLEVATFANFLGSGDQVKTWGPEYAHVMGGLDFRLTKREAMGPLLDFSIGNYTHEKIGKAHDESIPSDRRTTHFWLLVGFRVVISR